MNHISIVIKEKVNTILDNHEDPREVLDHFYVKQTVMLNKLRQDVAEVLTAKKRFEMQKARLWHYIHALHEQARRSLDSNMVDKAKVALQHKNLVQVQSLDK
jgi:phage shock protein A